MAGEPGWLQLSVPGRKIAIMHGATVEGGDERLGRRRRRRRAVAVALALTAVEAVVVGRRRGSLLRAETIVRCRSGHLFTTLWVPGASLKAVRLGWWRYQRCPVGPHWALVTPARVADLTEAERQAAAAHHDSRLP